MSKFTRKEIWQHNGFLGTCVFARKGLQMVIRSRTATPNAKLKASIIIQHIELLEKELKRKATVDAN